MSYSLDMAADAIRNFASNWNKISLRDLVEDALRAFIANQREQTKYYKRRNEEP